MEKIGIFCSAAEHIDKTYFDAAGQLGQWMGENGKTLIYGGASLGLMECVAAAVKGKGGTVVGVVPSRLEENGKVSGLPDRIIHTRNLSERKDVMVEESNVLIALPGGIGTLDEVFHVLAAASIGYHRKKVIFYNVGGFYNKLLGVLDDLQQKGFCRHPLAYYYEIATTFEELTTKI